MKKTLAPESPEEAILDAAATVFAEHGFAGARVEAIAKAAGLNKAMLYYRVGDKARLYELVITRQFERVARAAEAGAGGPGGPAQRLGAMLRAIARLFGQDPRLPRIMAWELASGGGNLPESVVRMWGRILAVVAPLAEQAGLDPLLTHLSLVGPLVFICLTEPIRERLGGGLPDPLRQAAEIGVEDMAAFLGQLYSKAAGERA